MANTEENNHTDLTAEQQWLVSLGSMLSALNYARIDKLAFGEASNQNYINNWARMLSRDWSINNRESLQEKLDWLYNPGNNKCYTDACQSWAQKTDQECELLVEAAKNPIYQAQRQLIVTHRAALRHCGIIAYDVGRYVHIVRAAHYVGYLSEHEAWQALYRIGHKVKPLFSDWHQFALSYITGRSFCRVKALSKGFCDREFKTLERILMDNNHPWNQLKWDTPLSTIDKPYTA